MDSDTSKEKILRAAEELFAEMGFDKTSTASIAKRAGVNSALIFYYFGSKENLLKNILSEKVLSYRNGRNLSIPFAEELFKEKKLKSDLVDKLLIDCLKFMQGNENLIRISLVEALKKSTDNLDLFEINRMILNDILKYMDTAEYEKEDKMLFEIKELFFITFPIVMFTVLKQKMLDYYKVSEEELFSKFSEAFKDPYTHIIAKSLDIEVVE